MPAMRSVARRRWRSLENRWDEIESRALVLLARWLADGDLRGATSIKWLADRIITRDAVDERDVVRTEREGLAAVKAAGPEESVAATTGEDDTVAEELRAAMLTAMADLKPRHQQVLRAHETAQKGGPDIATALGVAADAARQLLSRARVELLEKLVEAGIELPEGFAVRKG
jgi:RNA polymerase sigma factor (sigma-70 family)